MSEPFDLQTLEKLRLSWRFGSNFCDVNAADKNDGVCEERCPTKFIQGIVEYDDPQAYMTLQRVTECISEALLKLQDTFDSVADDLGIAKQVRASLGSGSAQHDGLNHFKQAAALSVGSIEGLETNLAREEELRTYRRLVRELEFAVNMETKEVENIDKLSRDLERFIATVGSNIDDCLMTQNGGFRGSDQLLESLQLS